jgi:hypothetical protein
VGATLHRSAALLASLLVLTSTAAHGTVAFSPGVAWSFKTGDEQAPDITPAPDGGFYTASNLPGGSTGALTRYNSAGTQLWRQTLPARAYSVRSDAAGNAYLVGTTGGSLHGPAQGSGDAYLRKYSSVGALQWGRQFGTPRSDWTTGLALDAAGAAYLSSGGWQTNYGVPPPGSFHTARRFLADGTPDWTTPIDTQDGSYPGLDSPWSDATAVDANGSSYHAFNNYHLTSSGAITQAAHLARFTGAGNLLWTRPITGFGNTSIGAALSKSGNHLYLVGGSIAKYDAAGNEVWKFFSSSYELNAIHVSWDDRIFAAGRQFNFQIGRFLGFLGEFDTNGQLLWSTTHATAGTDWLQFFGLTLSGNQLIGAGDVITNNGVPNGNQFVAFTGIPEPATLSLAGLFLLALCRRRK